MVYVMLNTMFTYLLISLMVYGMLNTMFIYLLINLMVYVMLNTMFTYLLISLVVSVDVNHHVYLLISFLISVDVNHHVYLLINLWFLWTLINTFTYLRTLFPARPAVTDGAQGRSDFHNVRSCVHTWWSLSFGFYFRPCNQFHLVIWGLIKQKPLASVAECCSADVLIAGEKGKSCILSFFSHAVVSLVSNHLSCPKGWWRPRWLGFRETDEEVVRSDSLSSTV